MQLMDDDAYIYKAYVNPLLSYVIQMSRNRNRLGTDSLINVNIQVIHTSKEQVADRMVQSKTIQNVI